MGDSSGTSSVKDRHNRDGRLDRYRFRDRPAGGDVVRDVAGEVGCVAGDAGEAA
jgi:hypothetical protein